MYCISIYCQFLIRKRKRAKPKSVIYFEDKISKYGTTIQSGIYYLQNKFDFEW